MDHSSGCARRSVLRGALIVGGGALDEDAHPAPESLVFVRTVLGDSKQPAQRLVLVRDEPLNVVTVR